MTQKDSSQDFDPKHRIIGAIVIVALAVIFLPMVLKEESPESSGVDVTPAAQAEAVEPPAEPEIKVAITKVPPPEGTSESAAKPSPHMASGEIKKPEPAPARVASVSEAARETPAPSKSVTKVVAKQGSSPPTTTGWVVQVGTFSNTANASRLEQKLRAAGQPVRSERVRLSSGSAVRLRVGPFRDKASALKAQERIQRDVEIKGVVLSYP